MYNQKRCARATECFANFISATAYCAKLYQRDGIHLLFQAVLARRCAVQSCVSVTACCAKWQYRNGVFCKVVFARGHVMQSCSNATVQFVKSLSRNSVFCDSAAGRFFKACCLSFANSPITPYSIKYKLFVALSFFLQFLLLITTQLYMYIRR